MSSVTYGNMLFFRRGTAEGVTYELREDGGRLDHVFDNALLVRLIHSFDLFHKRCFDVGSFLMLLLISQHLPFISRFCA